MQQLQLLSDAYKYIVVVVLKSFLLLLLLLGLLSTSFEISWIYANNSQLIVYVWFIIKETFHFSRFNIIIIRENFDNLI